MKAPIEFQGKRYILDGNMTDGAITTQEAYDNWDDSYAHLYSDGNILRYGVVIGHRDDITVLPEED
jgi:hypothetical protein